MLNIVCVIKISYLFQLIITFKYYSSQRNCRTNYNRKCKFGIINSFIPKELTKVYCQHVLISRNSYLEY